MKELQEIINSIDYYKTEKCIKNTVIAIKEGEIILDLEDTENTIYDIKTKSKLIQYILNGLPLSNIIMITLLSSKLEFKVITNNSLLKIIYDFYNGDFGMPIETIENKEIINDNSKMVDNIYIYNLSEYSKRIFDFYRLNFSTIASDLEDLQNEDIIKLEKYLIDNKFSLKLN